MKKLFYLSFLFIGVGVHRGTTVFAQGVGINSSGNQPDPSAIFDASSSTKGVLITRVSLTSTLVAAPLINPATSLLIFNTATTGDVTPGFYYWDGTKWVRLMSGSGVTSVTATAPLVSSGGTTPDISLATNSSTSAGVVASGSGQNSMVWKTDAAGNPAWRPDETGGGTCPSGFSLVNAQYCIQTNENSAGAKSWFVANTTCVSAGARLCSWGEWYAACSLGASPALVNMTNNSEWVDDSFSYTANAAKIVGSGGCTVNNNEQSGTVTDLNTFRCCFSK